MIVIRNKTFSGRPKKVYKPSKILHTIQTGANSVIGASIGAVLGGTASGLNQLRMSNKRVAELTKKAASGDTLAMETVKLIKKKPGLFKMGIKDRILGGKKTRNAANIGAAIGAAIPVGLGIYNYRKQVEAREKYLEKLKKYEDYNKKK